MRCLQYNPNDIGYFWGLLKSSYVFWGGLIMMESIPIIWIFGDD